MEEKVEYIIPFKSLADGTHEFDFKVGRPLFSTIEHTLIEDGDLNAHVTMVKSQQMLKLHFDITGTIVATCDVCLGQFDYAIEDCEGDMVVKFGQTTEEISEELFQLAETEDEIDVAQWIYEILAVSLPIRFEHPEDEDGNPTCDPEMLKELSKYLITEEKTESEEPKAEETDPRWDALKKLVDKE